MSYHTSGSMSSYSGGYGTIKISLLDSGDIQSGEKVSYLTGQAPLLTDHGEVDVYEINGELFLIDPQYTIDSPNSPPFQSGDMIIVDVSLQTTITSVENIEMNGTRGSWIWTISNLFFLKKL